MTSLLFNSNFQNETSAINRDAYVLSTVRDFPIPTFIGNTYDKNSPYLGYIR